LIEHKGNSRWRSACGEPVAPPEIQRVERSRPTLFRPSFLARFIAANGHIIWHTATNNAHDGRGRMAVARPSAVTVPGR
jgi:hypothetical protein